MVGVLCFRGLGSIFPQENRGGLSVFFFGACLGKPPKTLSKVVFGFEKIFADF